MIRTLNGIGFGNLLAGLIGEQVDGVAGVVPQQVIDPRARLAQRVHIGAAEEVGVRLHLLQEDAFLAQLLVHQLVRRVEATDMAGHGRDAGFLLHLNDALGVGDTVAHGDFDQHVLAGAHGGLGLIGVDLRRAGDDDCVDIVTLSRPRHNR